MNNDLKKILQKLEGKGNNGGINITFDEKGISGVRGKDGYTPVKGVDYFTEKEIRQIIDIVKEMSTPVKGRDYFTALEVAQMIRAIESKVKHGKDGKDGRDGRDGKDAEEVDTRKVAIDAINFLESFEGDARLSAKALKDLDEAVTDILKKGADFELSEKQITTIKDLLPKYPPINAGGSGATFLKSLRDVDLSGLTKNADGKYVLGGGSGSSTFLALTDTPSSYSGQAGKFAKVNAGEDGLEFATIPGGGNMLSTNNLSDVADVATSRTNLGLGSAAVADTTDFAPALGTDDNYVTDAEKAALHYHSNKSVLDATTASFTTADETKLDYITVTQAVDLDAIETRVNALDAAVVLKGSWDASAGTFPGSGTAQAGDSYIVSVGGTVNSVVFTANDRIVAITDNASTSTYASNWLKLDYTDQVLSVNSQTGAVVLDADDIDDTATTNKFTTASDISKLAGIEAGADVTDTANVTAAGALMDSEVSSLSGIKTLTVPDSTTISTFGASLVDDTTAAAARTTLGAYGSGDDMTANIITYDAARGKVTAGGSLGATETINFNDETNYTGTLNSNITFTFANATSGDEVTLFLSYDGSAQRTITWSTVTWLDNASGTAPTTPSASGNVLVVTIRYIGTTYYASATGNYAVYA